MVPNAAAYLEETDDADPEVEPDGSLDDGESQEQQDLNPAAEQPTNGWQIMNTKVLSHTRD